MDLATLEAEISYQKEIIENEAKISQDEKDEVEKAIGLLIAYKAKQELARLLEIKKNMSAKTP